VNGGCRPELAVGTELELEKLVTELPLVSDIVAKIEIVAHFFPGKKHNNDLKITTILLPTSTYITD
jgi:hypothetical protein